MQPLFTFFFLGIGLLITPSGYALDTASLKAGSISGANWHLEGVVFEAGGLKKQNKTIAMSAAKLTLPDPFNKLTLANIRCEQFLWQQQKMACLKGRASVKSPRWQALGANFSFTLNQNTGSFKLDEIQLAGSRLSFTGDFSGQNWQVRFNAEQISHALADKLGQPIKLKEKFVQIRSGWLNLAGKVSGRQDDLLAMDITARTDSLTGQMPGGKIAAEKLKLLTHLTARKLTAAKDDWLWQSESKLLSGALYIDPVYLEVGKQPISLDASGSWNTGSGRFNVNAFDYRHPDVTQLSGQTTGVYQTKLRLNNTVLNLASSNLQDLIITYANPFFNESPFTGLTVSGNLEARLNFIQQALTAASIDLKKLTITDEAKRLATKEAAVMINWSDDTAQSRRSELSWQQLTLKGVPFDPGRVAINSRGKFFQLAEKLRLPLLGGALLVDQFRWQGKIQDEPDVSFAGSLKDVSLEKLSKSLGWTPLIGNISGQIPGVNYHNKVLSLAGELQIKVFDGAVKLNNLSASGLFSGLPVMNSDIAFDNIDLEQLTRKFEFGNITGKLTGFINKLVLENWRPVSFFAWFGTPDDDDSPHSISQKAVNNIASIGGGGAADVLSRSFLGFFETFRYDKIGVGCYLHNGVCQMSGVAAAEQGYYLIKGGCLPRIDVMGYNTQVNWDVLVERLARVASPDKAIIQ